MCYKCLACESKMMASILNSIGAVEWAARLTAHYFHT